MNLSKLIVFLVMSLVIGGLIMIANASSVSAEKNLGDKWHFVRQQSMWTLVGLTGFVFFSHFPLQRLKLLTNPIFLIAIILLILVLVPGIGVKLLGARRWINIGISTFQPAEFAKLALALYFSNLFSRHQSLSSLLFILGLVGGLVMLEPDMGTFLVIASMGISTYIYAGGEIKKLVLITPIISLLLIAVIVLSPYRAARLKTFLDQGHDPLGGSYHIRQAIISIGSGGIFGVGFGQSRQKYQFLPEVTTDSIFAVISEETGFVGSSLIVIAYLTLCISSLVVAQKSKDRFHANLAVAIATLIGVQAYVNISSLVALLPFTGIPMPFISYGGSALLTMLSISGILVNIAKNVKPSSNKP